MQFYSSSLSLNFNAIIRNSKYMVMLAESTYLPASLHVIKTSVISGFVSC